MQISRRAVVGWMAAQVWVWSALAAPNPPQSLTVATFNLENYLLEPTDGRPVKSVAAREQVARSIAAFHPDLLAVQELGAGGALADLQSRLQAHGLNLPEVEFVRGWDTNIFVAVLSRYPFRARRSHTNDTFLWEGRRWHSSRGTAEVVIDFSPTLHVTVLSTHLKSKRPVAHADEAELRLAEARQLRAHIDTLLQRDPRTPLIVLGDFNDNPQSLPIRLLLGRGQLGLVDTRPSEGPPTERTRGAESKNRRQIVWTHFYGQEDSYARFDYVLISAAMASRWLSERSYVYTDPSWGLASDHRPVVCEFDLTR